MWSRVVALVIANVHALFSGSVQEKVPTSALALPSNTLELDKEMAVGGSFTGTCSSKGGGGGQAEESRRVLPLTPRCQ